MTTPLTYNAFKQDCETCGTSFFQAMYVIVKGKEYKITDWYPDCDPVVDPLNPDLREEEITELFLKLNKGKK